QRASISTLFPYTTLFRSSMQYRKSCDSEFWQVTKENDGILGFPSCMLLFCVVDTLGSYFENNPEFKINIKGLSSPQIINDENRSDRKSTRLNSSHVKISY